MQKKSLIIISFLLILIFLAWFVIAELGANNQVKIISPNSNTNFTNLSLGQTFLNVTFVNSSGITGISAADFNVTYLMNNTGNGTSLWFAIATLTRGCVRISGNDISCEANSTNVTIVIPDGTYTLNANITNATSSAIIANLTNTSTSIKIDRTPPISTTSNFSSNFYAGANLSSSNGGVFTLNLSISDATVGVDTVLVNITNRSSGVSNATITLTREGSTNQFVTTINTSHYMDGSYNLTIIATDYLSNVNNSAVLENVIFDSTAPSVSFSCSPNPVEQNDVITCSCSATDVITGLNTSYGSSGLSFTANPSTTQTGPSFSVSCTSQDLAGNTKTVTTTYSVTSGGSGSGGGSSGGGGTGLSPPPSSSSNGDQSEEKEPETSGRSSQKDSDENNLNTSSGKIKTTMWLIISLIIAGIIIVAVVMKIKRKR